MKYEIRESDPNAKDEWQQNTHFYYLLEIDEENNQKVLLEDKDLDVVLAHEALKGKILNPIPEVETRGKIIPVTKVE